MLFIKQHVCLVFLVLFCVGEFAGTLIVAVSFDVMFCGGWSSRGVVPSAPRGQPLTDRQRHTRSHPLLPRCGVVAGCLVVLGDHRVVGETRMIF